MKEYLYSKNSISLSNKLISIDTKIRDKTIYEFIIDDLINQCYQNYELDDSIENKYKNHIGILNKLIEEPLNIQKSKIVKYIINNFINSNDFTIEQDNFNNVDFVKAMKKLLLNKLYIQNLLDNKAYEHLLHI